MENDMITSTRPTSHVPLLILGWLALLLIPGLGFFIGWYCFHVADERLSTTVTVTSMKVARFLSYFLVLAIMAWITIDLFT